MAFSLAFGSSTSTDVVALRAVPPTNLWPKARNEAAPDVTDNKEQPANTYSSDSNPSFQTLYTTSTQPPGALDTTNSITSQQWEKEEQEIFRNSEDFDRVQFVCKLSLFHNADMICDILSKRDIDWLNRFLSSLRASKVRFYDNLQIAREIVGLLRPTHSRSLPVREWSWILHALPSADAATIAERIAIETLTDFGKIPFHSLVRHILGYVECTVSKFIDGLFNSANNLARHLRKLQKLGQPIDKWILIIKALETRHPLTHWWVSASLPWSKSLLDSRQALYFLSEPVKRFFTAPGHDLIARLKQLAYLAERYKYTINEAINEGVYCPFSMDCSFIYAVFDPEGLAKSETEGVMKDFRCLSVTDVFDDRTKVRRSIVNRSLSLSAHITALVTADCKSVGSVMRLAEVLIQLKNYHTAQAVGCGLGNVGPWSAESWPIWKIIKPENNYAALLALSKRLPGIQWLSHSMVELKDSGNAPEQIYNIFQFVRIFGREQVAERETVEEEVLSRDAYSVAEILPNQVSLLCIGNSSPQLKRKFMPGGNENAAWQDELGRKKAKTENDYGIVPLDRSSGSQEAAQKHQASRRERRKETTQSTADAAQRQEWQSCTDSPRELNAALSIDKYSEEVYSGVIGKGQTYSGKSPPSETLHSLENKDENLIHKIDRPNLPEQKCVDGYKESLQGLSISSEKGIKEEERRTPLPETVTERAQSFSSAKSDTTEPLSENEIRAMMDRNFPAMNGASAAKLHDRASLNKAAAFCCAQDHGHGARVEKSSSQFAVETSSCDREVFHGLATAAQRSVAIPEGIEGSRSPSREVTLSQLLPSNIFEKTNRSDWLKQQSDIWGEYKKRLQDLHALNKIRREEEKMKFLKCAQSSSSNGQSSDNLEAKESWSDNEIRSMKYQQNPVLQATSGNNATKDYTRSPLREAARMQTRCSGEQSFINSAKFQPLIRVQSAESQLLQGNLALSAYKFRRASKPKVKTGCFTCRYRRLKCDEGRPSCQRCKKNNIECRYRFEREFKPENQLIRPKKVPFASVPESHPPVQQSPSKHPSLVTTVQMGQQAVLISAETNEPPHLRPHPSSSHSSGHFSDDGYITSSDDGDTVLLDDAIWDFEFEYGRRYHAKGYGHYWAPNDKWEQDRNNFSHCLWKQVSGGKLLHAPVSQLHKILDLGTGTGEWTIDIAEEYPSAQVTGIDITPIQPKLLPPNVRFQIDDFNSSAFEEGENRWDLIYGRELMGSVKDWPKLINTLLKATKPRGWIELAEHSIHLQQSDGKLDPVLANWTQKMIDSGKKTRSDFDISDKLRGWLESAGFVNVQEFRIPVPVGDRSDDPEQIGLNNQRRLLEGLGSYCLRPMIGSLRMDIQQVFVDMVAIRKSLRETPNVSQDFVIVIGQKPGGM